VGAGSRAAVAPGAACLVARPVGAVVSRGSAFLVPLGADGGDGTAEAPGTGRTAAGRSSPATVATVAAPPPASAADDATSAATLCPGRELGRLVPAHPDRRDQLAPGRQQPAGRDRWRHRRHARRRRAVVAQPRATHEAGAQVGAQRGHLLGARLAVGQRGELRGETVALGARLDALDALGERLPALGEASIELGVTSGKAGSARGTSRRVDTTRAWM
jgi:hypothetical protein